MSKWQGQGRRHSELDGDGYYQGTDMVLHRDPEAPMNQDTMLYQEPGPEPHRIQHYKSMSYIIAKTPQELKDLLASGWFRTTDEAHAAYLEASKPAGQVQSAADLRKAEIDRQMQEVDKKSEPELRAYGGILGVPVRGMNSQQIKDAIRAKLETQ